MIVRYSSLNRLEKPKFTLCNPGSTVRDGIVSNTVGMLVDTESEEIIFNFNATSELNFRINKIRRESEEDNLYTYRLFNAVQNRRLIFIDDIGYFMITNVDDNFDGGLHYKDVAAKSIDIEIAQKNVPYISDGTYKFTSDGSGDGKGILETIVETLPLWTIGSVDKTVAEKYRTFEGVDTSLNCLSFMLENMQDAFECIFIFDCVNRIINVYSQDNYVRETDIHITKDDLVNSLDITENADDLYTAITVLGNDNVTISAINPIGTNTIYDFSHYYDWMSDGLGSKVKAWQDAVDSERDRYYTMNMEYYTKLAEASNLEMEISKYDIQITMYTRCRNNIVASSESDSAMINEYNDAIKENGGTAITIYPEISETLAGIDSLISECESNKKNVQSELDAVNESITKYKDDIKQIQNRLAIMSYFTESEYAELCHYIYEGSYSDEYVVITDIMTYEEKFKQMKDLYDRAKNRLNQVSRPTQEFNVDVENFIFIKDFEQWSEQLETGCLINVELNTNDIALLFLSNITINYDDKKLTMTFGNRFNKFDAKSLFNNVLGKINKSANTLSYIKDILYPIKNGEFNAMREAIQTSRDLTMGQALASKNEEVVIDGSGYTGRRLLDSGLYDPRQIKITGKNIVLTDDAWESCKVAIGELLLGDNETIYGVNASAIIGDIIMGNSLRIVDKNGKDILTVVDDKISTSVSSVDEKVESVAGQISSITEDLSSFSESVTGSLGELQSQIDGQIQTYFYDYAPTDKNEPAVSWTTTVEKDKHLGDIFYVVDNETLGGQAYRWAKVDNVYKWILIEDVEVAKALADAAKAQDTADGKRRVFVNTPVPPYDVGDLWAQGTSGDLMRCNKARQTGSYVASDWGKATDYTNDDNLNKFINGAYQTTVDKVSELVTTSESITARVEETETTITTVQASAVTDTITQYYLSTSKTELSSGTWSETAPEWVDGKYMWSRTKTTKGDGSVSYSAPTCIAGATGATGPQGVLGLQGPKGDRGVQGPKGADGKTSYTHIAYANSADGATDFTVSNSNRAYIGMYVDFSETDSTNPGDYAWSKIKGADGANGTPGKAGADGKTPYFHVAYANNAAGTSGFSTTNSTNKLYIGQYTDYTQADSTDPKKYAWTKIKGDKGDTGESGVGVKSIDVQYYLSTSSTTLTGGSWSTTAPAWVNGKYMWSKTVTTLSNGGVEESKPVCITGAKGSTGTSGTTITSITEQYYLSTSKTQQTGGSWVEKPPAWSAGKYLWTRSKIVYANPTKTEYTTPVCDSSWEAVNEVQVGGTNLLLDTDAPSRTKVAAEYDRYITSPVDGVNATAEFATIENSPCGTRSLFRVRIITAQPNSGTTVAGLRFYNHTGEMPLGISFIPGEQYTMSCYARATSGAPKINMTMWGLTAWGWHDVPEAWTKFSLTFTATEEFNTNTNAWALFSAHKSYVGTLEMTGFKIEKGNKATDWSPSPDEAQYAIASIQVGARNLQLGTQFWDDNCIRLPGNAEINGEEITIPSNTYTELEKIQVKNGDVYTIGCDVKSDVAYVGNSFLVQLSNEAGTRSSYEWATGSIGTDWSRIVKTITISETESPLFLGIGLRANSGVEGVDCTLTYRHMMVERGNKPTDWAPAPEDVSAEIVYKSKEQAELVLSESEISWRVDNFETWYKDADDRIKTIEKNAMLNLTPEELELRFKKVEVDSASSVTTEAGYTFDDTGLCISDSGSTIKNLLNNTGMYVKDNSSSEEIDILTANTEGVNAYNLTARQYLIVGNHARFENYETNRTACFWI